MEEMIRNHENNNLNIPIFTTSTFPTWKLYENPFYISHHQKPQLQVHHQNHHHHDQKQIHRLHLPLSARKIASYFWDVTFIKESELEMARAMIMELKAELESQCKARKKMENLNKKLARELSKERKGREALERELAKEISIEINRMKKEIVEERKMLRTAEVIRERAEAKMLMEEKLSELEIAKKEAKLNQHQENNVNSHHQSSFGEKLWFNVLGEKMPVSIKIGNSPSTAVMQRKAYPEAENPHIKRGIKGFVEFPKVVRAIGCTSSKHLGEKIGVSKGSTEKGLTGLMALWRPNCIYYSMFDVIS